MLSRKCYSVQSVLFLESVVVVLDVDDARDWRDGSVTGDVLSIAKVEIHSAVGRTLLKYLDSSAHDIR